MDADHLHDDFDAAAEADLSGAVLRVAAAALFVIGIVGAIAVYA